MRTFQLTAGYQGKRICQAGIESGFKTTSLSRSGKPPKITDHRDAFWINQVNWKSADIFKPETYKDELKDAQSVVHSIGILLENQNYKKSINSNSSVLSEFSNLVKPSNPLKKSSLDSYEAINRDSAILLAETFRETTEKEDPSFVYISADKGFPGVLEGYIRSKREAEVELNVLKGLRNIIIRPGFMYDAEANDKTVRSSIKTFLDVFDWTNTKILGSRIPALNDLIRPTVSTQRVAQAIIYRIKDKNFKGLVTLDDLVDR